jgi:hypothetical protein
VTWVEELVRGLLPWLGGLAGLTVLYMVLMVYLSHRKEGRLARIEERLRGIEEKLGVVRS